MFHTLFVEHPQSVNESYFTHFLRASWLGTQLIGYGIAEYIHAIFPSIDLFHLFHTESTIELLRLVQELHQRKKKKND